jgi:ABC-type lipoprotein release transport system permease subunit
VFRMAWRNLWRNRRRTLITLASIAFGVLLTGTMVGINNYKYQAMTASSTRMGLGDVSVLPKGYLAAPSFKLRLGGLSALRAVALREPGVTAAYPRLQGSALFATAARNVGGLFMAVDPGLDDPKDNLLLQSLNRGSLFRGRDDAAAVVGDGLARKLKLRLGQKLVVTVSNLHGDLSSVLLRLSGTFHTGVEEMDDSGVLLPLGTAQRLLGYGPDEGTVLAVMLADERHSGPLAGRLALSLGRPDADVRPWNETMPQVDGLIKVNAVLSGLVELILGLMIAMGVLNTSLMSVLERRREFGVMLALGLSPWDLIRLVLAESLWTGLLGLVAGAVVSAPWIHYLYTHGLDMRASLKGGVEINGALLKPILYVVFYPESVALIAGTAMGLVLAAGIYPAYKAGSVPPMEAIRND